MEFQAMKRYCFVVILMQTGRIGFEPSVELCTNHLEEVNKKKEVFSVLTLNEPDMM